MHEPPYEFDKDEQESEQLDEQHSIVRRQERRFLELMDKNYGHLLDLRHEGAEMTAYLDAEELLDPAEIAELRRRIDWYSDHRPG
jgi:hypothetical protein